MLARFALAATLLFTQPAPARILFIGNSLTYSNDLPSMVCAMARSAGRQVTCDRVARRVNGLLLPAGDAWHAAWAEDSGLPLYGPDGFHPSSMGTYLAALVIYEQLFASPPPATLVPADAQYAADALRRAAHATVTQMRR
jgi:hypothetical protein